MSNFFPQIYTLLNDVILPHLKSIQASQAEQRLETDRLNRNLEDFRSEMHMRLSAIHAEIAACRLELEDTMVTLREREAFDAGEPPVRKPRRSIH